MLHVKRGGADSLRAVADLPVGAAADPVLIVREAAYAETLVREFDSITPENAMKWGPVHPTELGWNFAGADRLVEFAEANHMRVHGHTLVWHRQLPHWISDALTPHALGCALALHIGMLVGRYRGRVASWDVVNEAIADGGVLRDTIFLRKLGDGYIAEAFRRAHDADPAARLYYNDYGGEGLGPKSDAVYALVKRLREEGVPIHGVGLQMHLDAIAFPPVADITANVERLAGLGLEIRISEMDVRIREVRQGDRLGIQRSLYHDVVAACARTPGYAGVTFWGVADAHSWIDSFRGEDDPLLFDESYRRKPAYFGVRDAIAGHGIRRGDDCQSGR